MSRMTRRVFVAMMLLVTSMFAPAYAQDSVVDTLSFLLTTQAVPTGDFVKDRESAEITRDTMARLLAIPR